MCRLTAAGGDSISSRAGSLPANFATPVVVVEAFAIGAYSGCTTFAINAARRAEMMRAPSAIPGRSIRMYAR
jgi:hypothetical protein